MIEAFPEDSAPRFLLRDRDSIYGAEFRSRVKGMQIEEVLIAPHSPFQNPYVERVIGTIRRACLDHIIVLSERHLRKILNAYLLYYHECRLHESLGRNSPNPRVIESGRKGPIISTRRSVDCTIDINERLDPGPAKAQHYGSPHRGIKATTSHNHIVLASSLEREPHDRLAVAFFTTNRGQ